MNSNIVVGVLDPMVHPEATHIVAASGHTALDVNTATELRRVAGRGGAVLVDKLMAQELGGPLGHPRVFLLAADPGPVEWRLAVTVGAVEGFVVPAQAPDLLRALGQPARPQRGGAPSNGVIGAVGGCGASVFAASLARALGKRCVLIDADPCSGGLDLVLGAEQSLGARWSDLAVEQGAVDPDSLWDALPKDGDVGVLTCSRNRGTIRRCTATSVRAAVETLSGYPVVVDFSPRLPELLTGLEAVHTLVVLVPAELRAMAAAAAYVEQWRAQLPGVQILGVLRHRSWSALDIDEAERLSGLEFVGEIPHSVAVMKQVETQGLAESPRALRAAVSAVLEECG